MDQGTASAIAIALQLLFVVPSLLVGIEAQAAAPTVLISPKKIVPGGLMVVTVANAAGPVEGSFRGKQLHFNPARGAAMALIGIDMNTEPGTYQVALTVDGKALSRDVTIAKKKYPVQRLTLPEDMVVLSPENEARTERDQRKMSAIWPVDSLRVWKGRFIDPLPGKKIGTPFGVRRVINDIPKNPHSGVDITADEGEPVKAPNDGVVILVDDQFYSGNSVVLDHGQGIYTMFFHLSKATVKYGQAVRKGDVIALVGSTGRSTGAHLHWGARVQGAKVDPLELIKLKLD
jgi:murein DD-endopeptidase MepM/ murein hydrolase activator NlpD